MAIETDPSTDFVDYAHPERLVSTAWLAEHLGEPGLVVVESDEDVLLYDTGHIPGAVKIDWHTDLNDPVVRDYVSAEDVEYLAPYIFGHRLELAPGTDSVETVIRECMARPLERLARASLRR